MNYIIRKATLQDISSMKALIGLSARELSRDEYSTEQIEAALGGGVFGVDSQLIRDKTYFIAEFNGELVGCGGWSKRKTLFGSDNYTSRDAGELNPSFDAAKIRAFFINPKYARQGIAKAILATCENAAKTNGFTSFELVATLTGVKFYSACNYLIKEHLTYELQSGLTIDFIAMRKELIKSITPPAATNNPVKFISNNIPETTGEN